MIELEGLTKDFGSLRAVDGISLQIPRSEFFAVLGPNAAGKTTTIKMMVGLIRPTAGRARIAGFDIQENPLEARSPLSYVHDFPFLYEKLTPAEFLRFTGRLFRMPRKFARGATNWCPASIWRTGSTCPLNPSATEPANGSPSPVRCSTDRKSSLSTSRWWASTRTMHGW